MGVRPKRRIVPLQYAANPLDVGTPPDTRWAPLTGAQVVRCRVINYENDIGMTLLMGSFTVASQDASSGHGMTTIPQTTPHVDVQLPRATRYSRHRVRRWELAPHRCARSGSGNGWGKLRSCNRQGNDSSCRRWLVLSTGWWHALISSGGPGQ